MEMPNDHQTMRVPEHGSPRMADGETYPRGFEMTRHQDDRRCGCDTHDRTRGADDTSMGDTAPGDAPRRRRNPVVTAALGASAAILGLSSAAMLGISSLAFIGDGSSPTSASAGAPATAMPTEFAPAPAIATQEPEGKGTAAVGNAQTSQDEHQASASDGHGSAAASVRGDGSADWWVDGSGSDPESHTPLAMAKLAVRVAATATDDPAGRVYAKGKAHSDSSGDPWAETSDPRCQEYYKLMHAVTEPYQNDGTNSNIALGSCTQAVGHVVRATVDPDFHMMGPEDVIDYCSSSPKWEKVMVMGGQDVSDVLQPGDLLCSSGHTAMYVGNDLARQAFPGTGGTVYEASYSTAMQPNISGYRTAEGYVVFRFVGNAGEKNKHPFINPWRLLAGDRDYIEG